MRIFLSLLFFIMLWPVMAFAEIPVSSSDVSVNIAVDYQNHKKDGLKSTHRTHTTLRMNKEKQDWMMVNQYQSDHGSTMFLLSKIEKADGKTIALSFLLVDNDKQATFILEPKLIAQYGKRSKINWHDEQHSLHLTALVTNAKSA